VRTGRPLGRPPRPHKTPEDRFLSRMPPRQAGVCWIWPGGRDKDGYGFISVRAPKSTTHKTHRLSYEIFTGLVPEGLCVCHYCDNPPCCNPDHLWLGTKRDNNQDRSLKGRTVTRNSSGENNPRAILTKEDVLFLRGVGKPKKREGWEALSKLFGVSESSIRKVLNGTTWAIEAEEAEQASQEALGLAEEGSLEEVVDPLPYLQARASSYREAAGRP
jgi:hypothetical protein